MHGRLASICITALRMDFQRESTRKIVVFLSFLFSRVLITNSIPGKLWMIFGTIRNFIWICDYY